MRILYIQPNAGNAGSFQSLYHILERLDRTKYDPTVLFPLRNDALIEKLNRIQVKADVWRFPVIGYSINVRYRILVYSLLEYFMLKRRILGRIHSLPFDLIHLNSLGSAFGIELARKFTIPMVWHIREQLPPFFFRIPQRLMLSWFNDPIVKKLICISENEATGLPEEKVSVIHNFYRLEKQPFPHGPLRFQAMGSFTYDKGYWLLIDAVKILRMRYTPEDFKVVVMGISPRKTITKTLLREKSGEHFREDIINNHVESYFEFRPPEVDIHPAVFSEFHVLIRPSLNEDPWGRDIIEAMSTGRAIIATGTYDKFVRNGYNGFLVNNLDPNALAARMQQFIENRSMATVFGGNSYTLAKELFDPRANTKKLEGIYGSILE